LSERAESVDGPGRRATKERGWLRTARSLNPATQHNHRANESLTQARHAARPQSERVAH
jgi:hypothetical protein